MLHASYSRDAKSIEADMMERERMTRKAALVSVNYRLLFFRQRLSCNNMNQATLA